MTPSREVATPHTSRGTCIDSGHALTAERFELTIALLLLPSRNSQAFFLIRANFSSELSAARTFLSAVRGLRSMVSSLPSACFSTFGCGSAALNRATSQPTGGDEMRLESMAEQLEDKSLERSANPRFLRRLSETVLQEPNR